MQSALRLVLWRTLLRLRRGTAGRRRVLLSAIGVVILMLALVSRVYGEQFGRFPELGPLVRAKFVGVLWTLATVILGATVAVGIREREDWLWSTAPVPSWQRAVIDVINCVGPSGIAFLMLTIPATLVVAGVPGVGGIIVGLGALASGALVGGSIGLWWRSARARGALVLLIGYLFWVGSGNIAKWGRSLVDAGSGSSLAMATLVRGDPWATWPGDWVSLVVLGDWKSGLALALGGGMISWLIYHRLWTLRQRRDVIKTRSMDWTRRFLRHLSPVDASLVAKELRRLTRTGAIGGHIVIALATFEIFLAVMRPVPGLEADRWSLRLAQTTWLLALPVATLIVGEIAAFVFLPALAGEYSVGLAGAAPIPRGRESVVRMLVASVACGLLDVFLTLCATVRGGADLRVGSLLVVTALFSGSLVGLWAGALAGRWRERASAEVVAASGEGVIYALSLLMGCILMAVLGARAWFIGPTSSDIGALVGASEAGYGVMAVLWVLMGMLSLLVWRRGRAWASALD